jgi:hypothetical protein
MKLSDIFKCDSERAIALENLRTIQKEINFILSDETIDKLLLEETASFLWELAERVIKKEVKVSIGE